MSSVLGKQVALDDRLVIGNANQIVELGCNQNIQRKFPATQTSTSSIQWNNILSLGQFAVLDPRFVVEYQVQVQFDTRQFQIPPGVQVTYAGVTNAGGTAIVDPTPNIVKNTGGVFNTPTVSFAQYPLSRNTSTISLMLNSVETNTNLQQHFALSREWIVDAHDRVERAGTAPNYLDNCVVMPDNVVLNTALNVAPTVSYNNIPNQPNTHLNASGKKSRASFVPDSVTVTATAGLYVAVYTFREPVFISPLSVKPAPALANVQSLQLKYNIDASNNLLGMLSLGNQFVNTVSAIKLAQTNLQCSIVGNANLYIDVLSVDEALTGKIPEIAYYDYHFLEYNNTALSLLDASIAAKITSTKSTNGYKLTTMPKYWMCRLMPQLNGIAATNSCAGFIVDQITIQLGSLGIYTLYQQQLFQCFKNNTGYLDLSFEAWVEMGCPMLLNISVDVSSSQGIFQGITGTGGLMWSVDIQYNTQNWVNTGAAAFSNITGTSTAGSFYVYEAFVQAGSCAIGQGSCSFRSTTMSENEFLVATERGMVSNQSIKASSGEKGGSFFGSLRGILNGAHQAVKTGAQLIQHPMVQKGLQALAGSGVSGGEITHSARRRR
jgi:hypothetical protein